MNPPVNPCATAALVGALRAIRGDLLNPKEHPEDRCGSALAITESALHMAQLPVESVPLCNICNRGVPAVVSNGSRRFCPDCFEANERAIKSGADGVHEVFYPEALKVSIPECNPQSAQSMFELLLAISVTIPLLLPKTPFNDELVTHIHSVIAEAKKPFPVVPVSEDVETIRGVIEYARRNTGRNSGAWLEEKALAALDRLASTAGRKDP